MKWQQILNPGDLPRLSASLAFSLSCAGYGAFPALANQPVAVETASSGVLEPAALQFSDDFEGPMTPSVASLADSAIAPSPDAEFAAEPTAAAAIAPPSQSLDPVPYQPELAQRPTVSSLSDVRPGDWAYEALRSLVEEYGCLQGYPDNTFRGNQPMSRYEFAASLSACLDAIVTTLPDDRPIDLPTTERLLEEFAAELEQLDLRVDALEADVAELRANQFSTTTRLFGQVIFGVQQRTGNDADFFPVDGVAETEDPGDNLNLLTNAQLSLLTQFSPRSLLLVGMQAGQGSTFPRLNNDVRLGFEGDTDYELQISDLTYRHLLGDSFAVVVGAEGTNPVNVFRGANRVESAGFGPISALAQRNPIINIGRGSAGVGFDWQITNWASLQGVYSVPSGDGADPDEGVFQGDRTVGVQLNLVPADTVNLALNYLNAYSESGNLFTGNGDSQLTAGDAITTNAFGGTVSWDITPGLRIGGWGGYTHSVTPGEPGAVETVNWMAFLNFPDLFGEGNMGGIYVGQPPRITSSDLRQGQNIPDLLAGGLGDPGDQPGSTTHVEVFYRYRITEYLTITPGFMVIFDPAHTPGSDTIGVGVLRTTLTF